MPLTLSKTYKISLNGCPQIDSPPDSRRENIVNNITTVEPYCLRLGYLNPTSRFPDISNSNHFLLDTLFQPLTIGFLKHPIS